MSDSREEISKLAAEVLALKAEGLDSMPLEKRLLVEAKMAALTVAIPDPEPQPDVGEQKQKILAALQIERVYYGFGPYFEIEWPSPERLTAKTLLALAQDLGYSDVQVAPSGFEGEDCTLTFIK